MSVQTLRRKHDARFPGIEAYLDADRATAKSLNIELFTFPVGRVEDLDGVFVRMRETDVDGIKIVPAGVIDLPGFFGPLMT